MTVTDREPFLQVGGLLRGAALTMRYQLVLAAAGLGGIILASLYAPVAAMTVIVTGFLLYAMMVARDWSHRRCNPERWIDHPLELTNVYRAEPGGTGLLEQIVSCHETIRVHVASADPQLRDNLDEVFAECTDLVFEAARLEKQVAGLRFYLATTRRNTLEREHAELIKLADKTDCPAARTRLEAAASRKLEQLQLYDEIEALDDRGRAHIRLIKSTLDAVSTRLVKLRAHHREASAAARFSVTERVDALHRAVCDLDSGVAEVFDR